MNWLKRFLQLKVFWRSYQFRPMSELNKELKVDGPFMDHIQYLTFHSRWPFDVQLGTIVRMDGTYEPILIWGIREPEYYAKMYIPNPHNAIQHQGSPE
jgi:hypothetical protein